jgi:hypothetical protein
MRTTKIHVVAVAVTLLATGVGLGFNQWGGFTEATAASAGQKAQARADLDNAVTALKAVDTAYASGNAAEAATRYTDAKSSWDKVSPLISAREARESQLLYDSLGKLITSSAPPKKVSATISAMLGESLADVSRELR